MGARTSRLRSKRGSQAYRHSLLYRWWPSKLAAVCERVAIPLCAWKNPFTWLRWRCEVRKLWHALDFTSLRVVYQLLGSLPPSRPSRSHQHDKESFSVLCLQHNEGLQHKPRLLHDPPFTPKQKRPARTCRCTSFLDSRTRGLGEVKGRQPQAGSATLHCVGNLTTST